MLWRYPEPRVLTFVRITPVPFNTTEDPEISTADLGDVLQVPSGLGCQHAPHSDGPMSCLVVLFWRLLLSVRLGVRSTHSRSSLFNINSSGEEKSSQESKNWAVCHCNSLRMHDENFHTLCVIAWQRPPPSFQTCKTCFDICRSHPECSGVNIQVSSTVDSVIWQVSAATECARPQWGTEHSTFPSITHPPPLLPLLHFPVYHPPRQLGSHLTFLNPFFQIRFFFMPLFYFTSHLDSEL